VDRAPLALLLADDDAPMRTVAAARASERTEALTVLEAASRAEAIRIGLQRRPQVALLDVEMPRLGGIDAALTLRGAGRSFSSRSTPASRARTATAPASLGCRSSKSSTSSAC
jgi:CheY-like chemotaxis protein